MYISVYLFENVPLPFEDKLAVNSTRLKGLLKAGDTIGGYASLIVLHLRQVLHLSQPRQQICRTGQFHTAKMAMQFHKRQRSSICVLRNCW